LKDEDDNEHDPDLRVLEVMKLNYGRAGEALTLKWRNGLFLPVAGPGNIEQAAIEQDAEQLFLLLLDQFDAQKINVSANPTARNYAPNLFAKDRQAKQTRTRKPELKAAMDRLFKAEKIGVESYGPPSKEAQKLVRK
jgi:RecA-family ATPase